MFTYLVFKLVEIIGRSDESFAFAAKNAVETAGKTLKAIKWAEVVSLSMKVKEDQSIEYRARMKIAFEIRPELQKK